MIVHRPLITPPLTAALAALAIAAPAAADETYPVFEKVRLAWDRAIQQPVARGPYLIRGEGQVAQTTMRLPEAPADQRAAQRIVAKVRVRPVLVERDGRPPRPGDSWTRIGSLSVVRGAGSEVELMRFATGFGGAGTYVADLTALAPLLAGECTFRLFVSTFADPAWEADVHLTRSIDGVGQRRPVFAEPIFNEPELTAEAPTLVAHVDIPPGLAQPRIRLISTGHATDGIDGDEFVTRTHILRIDGQEVARFRPWAERGGGARDHCPMAGRDKIEGRELWSSDLDRSGWTPGEVVEPFLFPAWELLPGSHRVEIEVQGIRPRKDGAMGYWRISATVVADEPWPAGG